MINQFISDRKTKPGGVILLSGSGSNAETLLQSRLESDDPSWDVRALITDRPKSSRAAELAKTFDLPLIALDISEFYKSRGETRISIMSEKGQAIREEWTNELRNLLKSLDINFGVLAGFVPLTNLVGDFPCLNVHPGDLTVEENGRRLLVGLHTLPIETAILAGQKHLRSSVIIAQPYTASGGEMDSGPILGVSAPVQIEFQNFKFDELQKIADKRPGKRPIGGYKDDLEQLAKLNQEKLKENGDWVVLPGVVADFAAGNFATDEKNNLLFKEDGQWRNIKTVVYDKGGKKIWDC